MLIASLNPCPCGHYGDPDQACTCGESQVRRYQQRVSGPLLDRFDIQLDVQRVAYDQLSDKRRGESSAAIRELRPYRSGDPPSRIHWLSTARLDTLMVKEPDGEPMAQVWLLLDLQAAVQHGEDEGSSAELIIGVACGLIDRLAGAAAVGLLIAGPSTIVAPDGRHGRGHGERLRAALALTDTGDGTIEAALDLARHTAAGQSLGGGQGTVIALTPWADGQWAAHLARLARGNAVLCILLATPEGDAGEAHAAQAANLGRLGVRVYRHLDWAV